MEKWVKRYTMGIWERKRTGTDVEQVLETYYVSNREGRPGYFKTLTQALLYIPANSRIIVEGGVYNESIIIDKPCEIVALSEDTTPLFSSSGVTMDVQCDCYIEGIDVTTTEDSAYSVTIGTNVRNTMFMERCTVLSVWVQSFACPNIRTCTITGSKRCGVKLTQHAGGNFIDNTITSHAEFGIKVESDGKPQFISNMLFHSGEGQIFVNGKNFGEQTAPYFKYNRLSDVPNTDRVVRKKNDLNAEDEGTGIRLRRSSSVSSNPGSRRGSAANMPRQSLATSILDAYTTPSLPEARAAIVVSGKALPWFVSNTLTEGVGNALSIRLSGGTYEKNTFSNFDNWGVVLDNPTSIQFDDNVVIANNGGGIFCSSAGNLRINRAKILMNGSVGIYVGGESTVVLKTSEISKSRGPGASIMTTGAGSCLFQGNEVTYNSLSAIILRGQNITCSDNNIHGGRSHGVIVGPEAKTCAVEQNRISNNNGHGIVICEQADPLVVKNDVYGQKNCGIWSCGLGTLGYNSVFGNEGSQVVITDGGRGYYHHNDIKEGMNDGLRVVGNRSMSCPVWEYNRFYANKRNNIYVTEGNEIVLNQNIIACANVHGILFDQNSTGTVIENRFIANKTSGIMIVEGGNPVIRANVFKNSRGEGSIVVTSEGCGTIEKNVMVSSVSHHVHISGTSDELVLRCNVLCGAQMSAIFCENGANAFVAQNKIEGNAVGILCLSQSRSVIVQNNIRENYLHGVVLAAESEGTIQSNNINGNKQVGVVCCSGSITKVLNNVIEENGKSGVHTFPGFAGVVGENVIASNNGVGMNLGLIGVDIGVTLPSPTTTKRTNVFSSCIGNFIHSNAGCGVIAADTGVKLTDSIITGHHVGIRITSKAANEDGSAPSSLSIFQSNLIVDNESTGVEILSGCSSMFSQNVVAKNGQVNLIFAIGSSNRPKPMNGVFANNCLFGSVHNVIAEEGVMVCTPLQNNTISGAQECNVLWKADSDTIEHSGNAILKSKVGVHVAVPNAKLLLTNNSIHHHDSTNVSVTNGAHLELQNNQIYEATTGVLIQDSSLKATGNTIFYHTTMCVKVEDTGKCKVSLNGNFIVKNVSPGIDLEGPCANVLIKGNTLRNNHVSITVNSKTTAAIVENQFHQSNAVDIWFESDASAKVNGNEFTGGGGVPGCVVIQQRAHPIITANVFTANTTPGIVFLEGALGLIEENTFSSHDNVALLIDGEEASPTLSHNHFYANGVGVVIRGSAEGVFENNDFQDNTHSGMRVSGKARPQVKRCFFRVQKTGIEIHHEGSGMYIENTFEHIMNAALQISDPGTNVTVIANNFNACNLGLVATNKGTVTCNESNFNKNEVAIKIHNEARGYLVANKIAYSKTHGVVMRNSEVVFRRNYIEHSTLTGILVTHKSTPKIEENTFTSNVIGIHFMEDCRGEFRTNVLQSSGTGIVVASGGEPVVENNTIYDSSEVGILCDEGARGTIASNNIFWNRGDGIRLTGKNCNPLILSNLVVNNDGYGVVASDETTASVSQTIISKNAKAGVRVLSNGKPSFTECWISHQKIGVVLENKGLGTVDNCFIHSNEIGAIVKGAETNPTMTNNTIMYNENYGIVCCEEGQGVINNNLILASKKALVSLQTGTSVSFRSNVARGWLMGYYYDAVHSLENVNVLAPPDNPYVNGVCIEILSGAKGDVSDNKCTACRVGVEVNTSGTRSVIQNNKVFRCARGLYAIGPHPKEERGVVPSFNDNFVYACHVNVMLDRGARMDVKDNTVYDAYHTGVHIRNSDGNIERNDILDNGKFGVVLEGQDCSPQMIGNNVSSPHESGAWTEINGCSIAHKNNIIRNSTAPRLRKLEGCGREMSYAEQLREMTKERRQFIKKYILRGREMYNAFSLILSMCPQPVESVAANVFSRLHDIPWVFTLELDPMTPEDQAWVTTNVPLVAEAVRTQMLIPSEPKQPQQQQKRLARRASAGVILANTTSQLPNINRKEVDTNSISSSAVSLGGVVAAKNVLRRRKSSVRLPDITKDKSKDK